MNDMLTGAIAMASAVIAIFFLRFWRNTGRQLGVGQLRGRGADEVIAAGLLGRGRRRGRARMGRRVLVAVAGAEGEQAQQKSESGEQVFQGHAELGEIKRPSF